jgi:GR25 family glycosyltransferase involved in LPS biosynthesis
MRIKDIPKFVINLKRRPDRLESIKKEMDYIGWDYEVIDAIDMNSYMGCTLSHLKILEIAKSRDYEKVMVIEDDCYFMPYSLSLIEKLDNDLENINYAILNLSPTLNRHINLSNVSDYLLDMTNLPEKQNPEFREIYAANMIIYDKSIYDEVFKISETKVHNGDYFYAIDDFTFQFVVQKYQSYCPILPICCQGNDWSDVSQGNYNNFYTQTYNWNLYSPINIPIIYLDFNQNKTKKEQNIYESIN